MGVSFKRSQKGFTLIELIVVIAILGILASLAAAGFMVAMRSARDARRKSDLNQLSVALEFLHNDWKYYPAQNPQSSPTNTSVFACHYVIGGSISSFYGDVGIANSIWAPQPSRTLFCGKEDGTGQTTYMKRTPFDPLDTRAAHSQVLYKYRYYSYNASGNLCDKFGTYAAYCPKAASFKIVAVMENKADASKGAGDQDTSTICPKEGYCYVVSSSN
jgi:prepilin-type N-terminal cleavage/methylation domain-containing protein